MIQVSEYMKEVTLSRNQLKSLMDFQAKFRDNIGNNSTSFWSGKIAEACAGLGTFEALLGLLFAIPTAASLSVLIVGTFAGISGSEQATLREYVDDGFYDLWSLFSTMYSTNCDFVKVKFLVIQYTEVGRYSYYVVGNLSETIAFHHVSGGWEYL